MRPTLDWVETVEADRAVVQGNIINLLKALGVPFEATDKDTLTVFNQYVQKILPSLFKKSFSYLKLSQLEAARVALLQVVKSLSSSSTTDS